MKTRISHPTKPAGFAIISTMILMVLVALIAVGLMALVASRNRIAAQKLLYEEARQQARIGLNAAIAELQVEVGPDQRVTANSGIMNSSDQGASPYLLGVWNSWDGPIYGKSKSGKAGSIQETYDKGRSAMFRRWLISSTDKESTRQINSYKQLSSSEPGKRICLIGSGTLGDGAPRDQYIYADLISMPSRGQNITQYAWWVGGENQKAKINIEELEETTDPVEALHRTWDTPPASFEGSQLYAHLAVPIDNNAKVLTLNTLQLAGSSAQSAGAPYFFDITTHSYSLPVNISMGGFKQDLSLLFNKDHLGDTEFARRTTQDAPIAEQGNQIPVGQTRDMPIGSWQNMHAYHNTWPNGQSGGTRAFVARIVGNLNNAHTRMSGSAYKDKEYLTDTNSAYDGDYDIKTLLEEGSDTAGYARVPIMLSYIKSFFMHCEPNGQTSGGTGTTVGTGGTDPKYDLSVGYTAVVLWWNPYNVPMRVSSKKLWSYTLPYKTVWLQSFYDKQDGLGYRWSNYGMVQRWTSDAQLGMVYNNDQTFGDNYGEYFIAAHNDKSSDIVFAPGEILIFSPSTGDAITTIGEAFDNPFANEYDPKTTSGIKAHFYGSKVGYSAGQNTPKSIVDSGHFKLRLRLGAFYDPVTEAKIPLYSNMGVWFAGSPEMLTYRGGFNGVSHSTGGNVGQHLGSPHRYTLGWYDPDTTKDNLEIMEITAWNTNSMNDANLPYYVAALGITPKSANETMRTRFSTGDYRNKSWQYSSPAFFGSRIAESGADKDTFEQLRAYHPYQLINIEVGGGLTAAPVESIGRNGFYGGTGDGEQVSFISSLELPLHPPFSLAGYSGMRLSPGWFEGTQRTIFEGGSSNLIRQQYQSGVPSVGIGNSFADPALPADDIHRSYNHDYPLIYGQEVIFDDYFDHGLIINDALWDRFFTSSISDMPSATSTVEAQDTLTAFLSGEKPLPVSRYVKASNAYPDEAVIERLMAEDGWKYVAQFIQINGGFNINSTSVEAWAATLRGLSKRKLVTNVSGKLSLVEEGKNESDVIFSRFMVSTTDKSVDSLNGYSMMRGSSDFRDNIGLATAWSEVRKLDNNKIQELAERIVEQVRERGPFLNMSDFINRRLDANDKEKALTGALQAAIDRTSINDEFQESMITHTGDGKFYKFPEAALGSIHTAAPGYLIQSDVLMSLSNILTLRDDTFIVRSYGCVRNVNDAILAQAWCEAVVQRRIHYVDPTNSPSESTNNPDGSSNSPLSEVNQVMGRKLEVVSFRWLDHWDI